VPVEEPSTASKAEVTTNVFIERLWRSLKYECVFLNAFETGSEARAGIGRWIGYYNTSRPHSTFGGRTPDEVYARAGWA
jgi:putative transposase